MWLLWLFFLLFFLLLFLLVLLSGYCVVNCCCCFGRVFNSVLVHSCDANAAVCETNWWRVTWESTLPATPATPLVSDTGKTLLTQH